MFHWKVYLRRWVNLNVSAVEVGFKIPAYCKEESERKISK
jgi:hypothetical protein